MEEKEEFFRVVYANGSYKGTSCHVEKRTKEEAEKLAKEKFAKYGEKMNVVPFEEVKE